MAIATIDNLFASELASETEHVERFRETFAQESEPEPVASSEPETIGTMRSNPSEAELQAQRETESALAEQRNEAVAELRYRTAACKLSVQWFGTRKTLSASQKSQAAGSFGADSAYVSAAKKLLNTGHEKYKAVIAIRTKAVSHWKSETLPYPESGIRLIRQDKVELFDRMMRSFALELESAVAELDSHYYELREAARRQLGDLYNPQDYPDSLVGLFGFAWEFPAVDAPNYLMELNPRLYESETARITARFDEAVELAESAFAQELEAMVAHLSERLSGSADGKPKIFRDSAVENLREFFNRFRSLSVRSNSELDSAVESAQAALSGAEPSSLRNSITLREAVKTQLDSVRANLDTMMQDKPRRNIIR